MVIFSQCIDCKNYIGKNDDGRQICKAFLNGIPEDVFWNRIDHTKNIENDNGIKFAFLMQLNTYVNWAMFLSWSFLMQRKKVNANDRKRNYLETD